MRPLLKLLPFSLLALFLPAAVLPQVSRNTVSVSGVVLSEGQNQRIQHVMVRLCDSGGNLLEEATTLDSGEFSFRSLQRSPYIITFEANGFERQEIHLDLSFMSDRGMTIYMKPLAKETGPASAGATVSVHELSMPESARNLVASGRKKLYADKNPQAGLKDFQQAISNAPGYYEAYSDIAMAYVTMGKPDEAMSRFRKSIEVSKDTYGEAQVGLGTLLVEKGDLDGGEKALRRGIQLNPNSWMGFYELGKLDLNQNHFELALKSAERAKTLAPNAPDTYRLLANIHMHQQNYSAVLADIDAYLKLDPKSPAGLRAAQMREEVAKKAAEQKQLPRADSNPH